MPALRPAVPAAHLPQARARLVQRVLDAARPLRALPLPLQCCAAALVVLLAFWVRRGLDAWLEGYPFLFFLPAVLLVAFVADRRAALFAVVLSAALALLFFLPQDQRSWPPSSRSGWLAAAVYVAVTTGIALTVEALREAIEVARATEAALAESGDRLRLAMEAGGMGVWDWDLQADRLAWDARQYALFGMDPAQGQPTSHTSLARVHPEDRPGLEAAIAAALSTPHGVFQYEFRTVRPDGSLLHWIGGYGRSVPGDDGRPARMVGFNFEVTARRLAQQQLATSSREAQLAAERVQLALEAGAILGTWVWDLQQDTLSIDESFAGAFGLDPALGRTALRLEQVIANVHPDDLPGLRAAIDGALATGGPYSHQYRVRRLDGSWHWIEANGRVEHDAQGRPLRFPGVLLDVEERRAIEAERERATGLLRAFVEAVPAVVYAKDRDGRMLVANEATAAVLGQPLDALVGRTDAEMLGDTPQTAALRAHDLQVMAGGLRVQFEETLAAADGTERTWLSTKAPFRDGQGEVIGLVGASVDITERKQAEAVLARDKAQLEQLVEQRTAGLLRASDEARRAEEAMRQGEKLQALGQLTGGIAHDFNNLLQVVGSGLALLRMPGLDAARRERTLEGMARATRHAGELTRQLLSFARQQPLRPQVLDLEARLTAMAELLRHTLGARYEVRTRLAPGLPAVRVDPTQLETAVLNLAVNARDAMPGGGVLTVGAGPADGDAHVCLTVEDTGQGMPPSVLARVFEPFFTTKPEGRGTGLGLAQVHGFAKQSGGDVQVHSTPGQGTRFTLLLPRAPAGARPVAVPWTAADEAVRAGDRSVLVVDDNADVAAFVGTLLGELGWRVRQAGSAEEALHRLREEPADAVFSDIVMPGGRNGLELAATVVREHPGTAVVLATGYSEQLTRAGEVPYEVLAKPYLLGDVAGALQRALARAAARD